MATATKKKANRGTSSKAPPKQKGAANKATAKKVSAKKATAKKAPGANKKPVASKAGRSASAKKPVSGKSAKSPKKPREPERSSPAMAEVDAEVLEFIAAIDDFKQRNGRPFPSWSEVLLIVRELGYRRA